MGRRGMYEQKVKPRLKEIEDMDLFLTQPAIAQVLGISQSSLEKYARAHPELREALDARKDRQNSAVYSAILKAACGHHEKVRKRIYKNGKTEQSSIEEVDQYYPPNMAAATMWLRNNDPAFLDTDASTEDRRKRILELKEKAAAQWDRLEGVQFPEDMDEIDDDGGQDAEDGQDVDNISD